MSDARTELVFAISTASFACNQVLAMQRSDAAPGVVAGGGGNSWAGNMDPTVLGRSVNKKKEEKNLLWETKY